MLHSRFTIAGLLLGIGLGGFFDGIILHQVLQWHHMLTSTGEHPATTVAGLETNTLWDGFFHLFTYAATIAGLERWFCCRWKTRAAGKSSRKRWKKATSEPRKP